MGEIPERATSEELPVEVMRTRRLCRLAESVHTVGYYTPEIRALTDEGFRGWWHAYFGYRFAPLGEASLEVVTATAYNFAPVMVARAIPSAWQVMSPEAVLARHRELVAAAFARIFADGRRQAELAEAAALARRAVTGLPLAGRALFAGHAALDWPDGSVAGDATRDAMNLWHACTLVREFRFDGHNAVLLANDVDGVACHVLMAAFGHGNQPTIERIRGWTSAEWDAAVAGLAGRGWITEVDRKPHFTDAGRAARAEIERDTDRRAVAVMAGLAPDEAERLLAVLGVIVDDLLSGGEVAGVWPPPTVLEPG